MFTLDNFYQSKEWVNLTHVLRLERLTRDGELICEYCGKPITEKYDAIGHHTVYLTEENVNDVYISLNPSLIQFVHHKCHNKIHEKFGHTRREVFLVYGSPLSGIQEYVQGVAGVGDLIVDIDRVWQCVTGCETYIKPPVLNGVAFGVRDFLIDCIRVRRGKWNNAYLCGGYPLVSERERLCKQLGARPVYIESTREECLKKLHELNDGRDVKEWEKYINDWWIRYRPDIY